MQSVKISLLSSSFSPDVPPRPYSGWAVRTFPVRLGNSRPPAVSRINPPSSSGSKPSLRPCFISSSLPGVQEIGELVGLNSVELERALCSRTVETAREKVVTALTVTQVRGSRGRLGLESVLWLLLTSSPPSRLSTPGTPWPRTSTADFSTG